MIFLRTSGKTLPGKKLAIYISVVIAVLVLSYNLSRDLPFILVSDKEGILNFKVWVMVKSVSLPLILHVFIG